MVELYLIFWSDLGGKSWVMAWVGSLGLRGFGAGGGRGIEPLLSRFQDATGEKPKLCSLACNCATYVVIPCNTTLWADVVSYPRHPEVTPSQWHTGLPQANRKLPQYRQYTPQAGIDSRRQGESVVMSGYENPKLAWWFEWNGWIKIVCVFLVSDERNCPKTGPRLCENEMKTWRNVS